MVQKVEHGEDLVHNLVRRAEVVGIILLESSDSGESRQGSTNLVSMKHSEISESHGQLSISSQLITKHQTVGWAVHGLHAESLILNLEQEKIFFIL